MDMPTSSGAASSPFKLTAHHCTACGVAFKDPEARRTHAKTKWHVENLRRRVAGLEPLDPPQEERQTPYDGTQRRPSPTEEFDTSEDSEDSDGSSKSGSDEKGPIFAADDCLFCSHTSEDFDANVAHMQKTHGLFIPHRDHLIVDLETLVQYLHLVIFGYQECLYCHSQRSSAEAAQQHMLGKGHCKIDLSVEDSEFLDFYDFAIEEEDLNGEGEDAGENSERIGSSESQKARAKNTAMSLSRVDDNSARLPSGKLLSHRSAPQTLRSRQQTQALTSHSTRGLPSAAPGTAGQTDQLPTPDPAHLTRAPSTALTKSEKRENALTMQLASLSVKDRAALAHLPVAEQRAALATQKKQADKARRAERRHRSRVELMGNRNLMHHFVSDVPGPKLG